MAMIEDEECRQDAEDYRKASDEMLKMLRARSGSPPIAENMLTNPEELVGKQIAKVISSKTHASRAQMVIKFTDGTYATAYLARETDVDWVDLHLSFNSAWTKSQGGNALKRAWQKLEQLLYWNWGIDTMEFHSPQATARIKVIEDFMDNKEAQMNNGPSSETQEHK